MIVLDGAFRVASILNPSFLLCRIRHTIVLDDPFDDPPQLEEHIPEQSPEPQFEKVGVQASSTMQYSSSEGYCHN